MKLPFFAYGIFKSSEIAWPRISSFVDGQEVSKIRGWNICIRNGLPLDNKASEGWELSGDVVRFRDQENGYKAIGDFEPSGEYK